MADLTADDFPRFFEAIYGHPPFAWQADLAHRVLCGEGWPAGIDVPTGMGKTAVLDIAVFALASQAGLTGGDRTAPTRTFMVVDRRLIVDQAYVRAKALSGQLQTQKGGVVERVASALRRLSGGQGPPLEVVRMRGGVTWSWRWLRSPDQPAVVVGTVDQFGSRLLFRGYGVGARLRPIDAALTGADALLVLDEAHISWPLANTTAAVRRYESMADRPVFGRRHPPPVLMSATLPADLSDGQVFRPDPTIETSDIATRRLGARKTTVLVDLASRAKDPAGDLAKAMAQIVLDRVGEPGADRLAVVCNTISIARSVFDILRNERGESFDTALLIGRCREFDRTRITAKWATELEGREGRQPRACPLVAVATQTIEVGADFDVDTLISEAAPLDALLQRLGRLNRFGRPVAARAVVVRVSGRHDDDPVYGSATSRTWDWLVGVAGTPDPTAAKTAAEAARNGPTVDLGTGAIGGLLSIDERRTLAREVPDTPEVIGPTLAAWARTSPAPEPDQPVAPFLHGLSLGAPEVLVCWRAGLPEGFEASANEAWEDELRTTPPSAAECVSVPIWEARRLLDGRPARDLSDIEGSGPDDDPDPFQERPPVTARIVSDDGTVSGDRHEALRPGVTVVLQAESGGHDEWGWTGQIGDGVVPDVADLCRRRPALRLRPALLASLMGGALSAWEERFPSGHPDAGADDLKSAADQLLAAVADGSHEGASTVADELRTLARELRADNGKRTVRLGSRFYFVQAAPSPAGGSDQTGDDAEGTSSTAGRAVSLERHLLDVAERGADVAARLGLPGDLIGAVELAGRAHDLGKADRRFQVMLHRGDALRAEACDELLAKSGMDPADRKAFHRARVLSGWPSGMHHEAASAELLARMVDASPDLVSELDFDLILHLVASHHGRSRPLLSPALDPAPVDIEATLPRHGARARSRSDDGLMDWNGPSRFERLGQRYGWWGLALLETIVRLADIACSEGYDRDGKP